MGVASSPGAVTATRTAVVTRDTAAKRAATRAPSRAASMAAITARAGQAVAFIAHATPMARPAASSSRGDRATHAKARQVSAIIGGSVMPTASGSTSTGEATANTALHAAARRQAPHPSARCGAPIQNAAASRTTVAAASHSRVSPSTPRRPNAHGRPKTVIAGRYGL